MAKLVVILCVLVFAFAAVVPVPLPSNEVCECKLNENTNMTELLCKEKQLNKLPDFGKVECDFDKVVISLNDISVITNESFVETPDLTIVHLYTNNIDAIEEAAFRMLSNLQEVDLSDNDMVSIDPWLFSENAQLETVVLSNNPLVDVDEESPILSSPSVTTLLLDDCKLSTLTHAMLSQLPNLQVLDISSNQIKSLSLAVFDDLPNLKRLELDNNRWRCDCDLKHLVMFADRIRDDRTLPLTPIKCFTPEHDMVTWTEDVVETYCKTDVDQLEIEVIEDDDDDSETTTEDILLADSFIVSVAGYLNSVYSFLIILALLILTITLTIWIVKRSKHQQLAQRPLPTTNHDANKDNKFYMFTSTDHLLSNAEQKDHSNMVVSMYSDDLPIVFQYPARSNVHIYESVRDDVRN